MGWIKRNLFFVIGGVITLVLLGGAGFYIWKGWSANSDATTKLNELYATYAQINQEPQQPGNDKIDNVATAKEQEQQMEAWMSQATGYFQPIAPIPAGQVTSKTFASALNNTVNQLRQEAKSASVTLPPPAEQYNFSFQAQSTKLTISSGLDPLAEQLGQVKAISEVLFAAGVNDLLSIQRIRMSDDDASASASDYIDDRPVTNTQAIIAPYLITFETFTPELAKVLVGFATSTNPFIAKLVSVQPANASGASPDMGAPMAPPPPGMDPHFRGQFPPGDRYANMAGGQPPAVPPGYPPQGTAAPMGKGGLQTVLKEQLLRITLQVEIVKLLPPPK